MTKLLTLTRKQTVRFSALAILLVAGIAGVAVAAPSDSKSPAASDKPTDRHPGMGPHGRGFDPFARFDKDNDGKIILKDLPARPQQHLSTIDKNKDGTLTREEFEQGREQLRALREKELDTNKDGKVTEEERKTAMRAHFAERFAEDDKNHDGFLTADEIPGRMYEHLSVADKNQDKKLSKQEIEDAFANGTLGRPGQRGEGRGPKSDVDRKAHMQQRFTEDDKNKDGFLVQSEVSQRWDRIKIADSNNDNKVSLAELQAAHESGKLGPRGRRGDGNGPHHGQGHGQGNGQGQRNK